MSDVISSAAGNPPIAVRGARASLERILGRADVQIDGGRPWDIRVHHERFFRRVLGDADLGFGESYMDGDWSCDQLDETAARLFATDADYAVLRPIDILNALIARAVTRQTRAGVKRHVAPHYDLGNDLFEAMLDTRYMAYTCAYWRTGAATLEEASHCRASRRRSGWHAALGCPLTCA
jgi:cyclopropane-fatty-acyl-phospholipid synthase